MTRILMTADAVGGVWTYALELAAALEPYDVAVHLAVMGPPPTVAQRSELARSAVASLHANPAALEWMDDPWPEVDRAADWLLDLDRELAPDAVHLNGYVHAALPWRSPTLVVAHSDVVSWWRAVHGTAPPTRFATYVDRVRSGLHAADAVVAPTRPVLDDLRESFGFTGGRVIPNGRRSDWVHPQRKEQLIAAVGRVWDEAKNLALLQTVAGDLPWPLTVAGPDGSSGLVAWTEIAQLLLRASIFVGPARYEPFGLAALEAGLAGCALVLGDIPSLRAVWGDAAIYVAPDDADGLAAAVTELCAHPDLLDEMSARAAARAQRYSTGSMAAAYAELYQRLPRRAVTG